MGLCVCVRACMCTCVCVQRLEDVIHFLNFFKRLIFIFCDVCAWVHVPDMVYGWQSEDNLLELVLYFYHVDPGD